MHVKWAKAIKVKEMILDGLVLMGDGLVMAQVSGTYMYALYLYEFN
jgi:hypothetical protein